MPTAHTRITAVAAVLAALSAVFVAAPARADQSVTVPVVHLEGRGHGHGVGMSQWGAFTMAKEGAAATDIIAAFYPGTALATQGGEVVVGIDRRDHLRIEFPGGGEIRSARNGEQQSGFPVSVAPGGVVDVIRESGGYRVVGGSVTSMSSSGATRYSSNNDCVLVLCSPDDEPPGDDAPPPTTPPEGDDGGDGGGTPAAPPPSQPEPRPQPGPEPEAQPSDPVSTTPVWAVPSGGSQVRSVDRGRSYRGLFEVTGTPGNTRLRNHVDIEDYLKGMAEVPGTWPQAAVQAQAIAARTYALRAMAGAGELCDTESCQVYVGTAHESAGQVAAVDATRNVVVTHGGALASTFYSASGGGFSANVAEGFGTASDVPYLQARPYATVHPDEWTVDIALSDVARRLGYGGKVTGVRVDEVGPSGRPLRMTLEGDAGDTPVDPQTFRRKLGLRSTLFKVKTTQTENAPPPPPETVDPGVVGAGPDAADRAAFSEVRRPTRDVTSRESIAAPPFDGAATPRGAAVVAFALLVLLWTALTLQTMTSPTALRITMARWTNRSR